MTSLDHYRYRGARAMVLLHERYLCEFVRVWREFRKSGAALPVTDDPDYQSAEHVLRHVLGAARGYMTWMCEQLELPDPEIDQAPEVGAIEGEADRYLEHLLERWRLPLADVAEVAFDKPYRSRWETPYCVDAMLEHAVMHPLRHSFQLRELMPESLSAARSE